MNNAAKIGLALAMLFAGAAIATNVSQSKNLVAKFKLNPLIPNNINISSGLLNINFPVQITNQSAFDVLLKNLYVNVAYKDANGIWQDLFYQQNGVKEVLIKKLVTSNLNTIPLSMPISSVFTLLKIVSGSLSRKLLVSTRFEVSGIELAPIQTEIDSGSYLAPIITILKKFGLAGSNNDAEISGFGQPEYFPSEIGYAGFHHREIKPMGSFTKLLPQVTGNKKTIRNNGSAYDTISDMADIVNRTLHQTKALASALKGKTTEQTARNIFSWCHDHIQYERDQEGVEQLREPARILSDKKGDCDCFSILVSSLLLNNGINNHIEMCQISPDPWFKHVYVIVPKTPDANLKQRSSYWVVDACLHSFDEKAPNITLTYNHPMITEVLSGLSCAGKSCTTCASCNCPQKQSGTFGVQQKKLGPISASKINEMELQILEPMRQNLIKTRAEAIKNPGSVSLMYHPGKLVQSIDYALKNWNDPARRAGAFDVLAKQDQAIINQPVLKGLMGSGAFRSLDGVDYDPTQVYPIMGFDESTEQLTVEGLGGLWDSMKSAAKSVGKTVSKAVTQVGKDIRTAAVGTSDKKLVPATAVAKATNKALTAVKNAAVFVARNIQKVNPIMVAARTAYRGLVALNFRGMASDMAKAMTTAAGTQKIKDFWVGPWLGGNYGDLVSAINAGKNKKRLLGEINGYNLGEPVTVAASVVTATPILAKAGAMIKAALTAAKTVTDTASSVKESVQTVKDVFNPGSTGPAPSTDPSSSTQIDIPGIDPGVRTTEAQSDANRAAAKSNTGLYVGLGLAAAAVIAYAMSSGNHKPVNGIPQYAI